MQHNIAYNNTWHGLDIMCIEAGVHSTDQWALDGSRELDWPSPDLVLEVLHELETKPNLKQQMLSALSEA